MNSLRGRASIAVSNVSARERAASQRAGRKKVNTIFGRLPPKAPDKMAGHSSIFIIMAVAGFFFGIMRAISFVTDLNENGHVADAGYCC